MQNKRPSIYLSDQLETLLAEIQGAYNDKVSSVINSLSSRYQVIAERNIPELTPEEWLLMMDFLKDYNTRDITRSINAMPGSLSDYLKRLRSTRIDADFPDLIGKLYFEEKLAIIHISEKYWTAARNNSPGWELLEKCLP